MEDQECQHNPKSLKQILKNQEKELVTKEQIQTAQQKYFSKYTPPTYKSIKLDELKTIQKLVTQQYFDKVAQDCKQQRTSTTRIGLSKSIEADAVELVLRLATQLFSALPNCQQVITGKLDQKHQINTEFQDSHEVTPEIVMCTPKADSNEKLEITNPQVIIVGDTHGTFEVLEKVFNKFGIPSDKSPIYVFNGDYVDRGSFSVEIFIMLCIYKLVFPQKVFMTRGNHESQQICQTYSFLCELYLKYSTGIQQMFQQFTNCFIHLPVAVSVNSKLLIVHGGVNTQSVFLTDVLQKLNRHREPELQANLFLADPLNDFMWSDPFDNSEEAIFNYQRQTSSFFGQNGINRFLKLNNHEVLIRSHTACEQGYEKHHAGRTWTLFSVPRYMEQNLGSILLVNNYQDKLQCNFMQFDVSEESAIDKQLFCNEQLIMKYNSLTVGDLMKMKNNSEQLQLLLVFLISGCIEAGIEAPKQLFKLTANNDSEIELPEILQKSFGLKCLMENLITFIEENEMDPLSLLGCIQQEYQSDCVLLSGFEVTLYECGIKIPKGLFWSIITQENITDIVQKSEKQANQELRRREQRKQKIQSKQQKNTKNQKQKKQESK